jgi:opacity protein-like surface antigen
MKIQRLLFLVVLSLFLNVASRAQEFPKAEVFGGYSYGNFTPTIAGAGRTNLNGWNASLGVNVNRWFGLVSDFSGNYGSLTAFTPFPPIPCAPTVCGITTAETDKFHNFLFGPQFAARREKLSPFVHALFGGSRLDRSETATITPPLPGIPLITKFSASTTNFAFAGGGGVDYKFTERFAWRVQADYLEIGQPNRTLNNFRLSTGVVIHF